MFNYFSLPCPNIKSLNGADNAIKFLEFYNAYYKDTTTHYKPIIKVVLDNDNKGREIYSRICVDDYKYIDVTTVLLQNHTNNGNVEIAHNNTNNEIEDFLYPEVVVYLINLLLEKKNMAKLNSKSICSKIHTPSFSKKGILELCEYEKNTLNPDNGAELSFVSSGKQTNQIKEGLAGMFNLKANKSLLSMLAECDAKYPYVKQILIELCNFSNNE